MGKPSPLAKAVFSLAAGYKTGYKAAVWGQWKRAYVAVSPCHIRISGGRIRTSDLRVMSPTSYLAALPRDRSDIVRSDSVACQGCLHKYSGPSHLTAPVGQSQALPRPEQGNVERIAANDRSEQVTVNESQRTNRGARIAMDESR